MNSSKSFIKTIKSHLDEMAFKNPLFAEKYNNSDKSVEDCCNFILNEVKKMNVVGLTDDEVFSLAIHFYEEGLEPGSKVSDKAKVVINHLPVLTEAEKKEAKKKKLHK